MAQIRSNRLAHSHCIYLFTYIKLMHPSKVTQSASYILSYIQSLRGVLASNGSIYLLCTVFEYWANWSSHQDAYTETHEACWWLSCWSFHSVKSTLCIHQHYPLTWGCSGCTINKSNVFTLLPLIFLKINTLIKKSMMPFTMLYDNSVSTYNICSLNNCLVGLRNFFTSLRDKFRSLLHIWVWIIVHYVWYKVWVQHCCVKHVNNTVFHQSLSTGDSYKLHPCWWWFLTLFKGRYEFTNKKQTLTYR